MKKSNLITGFIYLIAGMILLLIAIFTNTKLDSLLCGFAGVGIGPGLMIIFKYFYWNKPENKKRYQEKSEKEAIELHDELNIKLRDKSGHYAYVYGIIVICFSIVVFSILGQLEIITHSGIILLYLGAYLIFQLVINTTWAKNPGLAPGMKPSFFFAKT